MAVVLIIISFSGTLAVFFLWSSENTGFRMAFLKSALLHGLVIVLSSELLSVYNAFSFASVAWLWGIMSISSTGIALFLGKKDTEKRFETNFIGSFPQRIKHFNKIDKLCLLAIAIILCITLATALFSPPNNLDSLSYHMPRVMHWIQNGSISPYPTNNLRQIAFPPGAEYAVAHLMLLSGNDRFANCVQWTAFLGCIVGVSLIAQYRLRTSAQILSAFLCATLPMAILQSVTTQTDLLVSFWLVCGVCFISKTKPYTRFDFAWIALSLGLAVLTKPTAYFFGFPFLILLAWCYLKQNACGSITVTDTLRALVLLLCIGLISLSLSGPGYWRNYRTFRNIFGTDSGTRNTLIGVRPLVSNVLRNISLNLPLPIYWHFVTNVHDHILDLDVDDPRTTFKGNAFSRSPEWLFLMPDEDFAGNPLHLLIFFFSVAALSVRWIFRRDNSDGHLLLLAFTVLCGFLFYSICIKWQIWGSRLYLASFILLSPAAASCITQSRLHLLTALSVLIILVALVYGLFPVRHPLISLRRLNLPFFQSESILHLAREAIYYNGNFENMEIPLQKLAQQIRTDGCHAVGVSLERPEYEYALWVEINAGHFLPVKLKHININNPSIDLQEEFSDAELCAIAFVETKGVTYKRIYQRDSQDLASDRANAVRAKSTKTWTFY